MTSAPTLRRLAPLLAAMLLAGCASSRNQAPVEERAVGNRAPSAVTTAPMPAAITTAPPVSAPSAATPAEAPRPPPPGIENLGKPGYYQVKPGETLIRIALENGQNWKDLVAWNSLANPNVIEAGQVLRVVPPGSDGGAATRPVGTARIEPRPIDARPPTTTPPTTPSPSTTTPTPVAATREGEDDVVWQWPASGSVASGFEEGRTKGLAILGKAGDPVLAAADGKVVYAGSGLRGYGNLVILKHNNTWLTAYAHNQSLLVKEDQAVRRGQKIAEMGSSDAERVQLHFEIRRQGKPVDPAKLLPQPR